jgi:hypothetical protein
LTMTNYICLSSSAINLNVEKPTTFDHQALIHENDSVIPFSQNQDRKLSSSYLTLSIDDNRYGGLSDFHDPLFYQQPVHFHYNQPISLTTGLEHEKGDRARFANEIKFNKHRKEKPVPSHKNKIEKSQSTHRPHINPKKSKDKIIKPKEKKKTHSTRCENKQKHKNKKTSRNNIQSLQYQVDNTIL